MAPHVEEQLTLYVLGSLTAEEEAAVVGHVEGCVECAAALSRLKETVDSLARDAVPVAPSPEARRRLLRTIRGPARFADLLPAIAQLFDLPLEEVRAMVDGLFDPSRWMEGPAPGISLFPVQTGPRYPEAFAGFVRVLPGRKFPSHRHTGAELNLVLQGGLREVDTGKEVWAGEQLTKDAGSEHAYVALEGSDCIAASVVNGFIELTDSGGDA